MAVRGPKKQLAKSIRKCTKKHPQKGINRMKKHPQNLQRFLTEEDLAPAEAEVTEQQKNSPKQSLGLFFYLIKIYQSRRGTNVLVELLIKTNQKGDVYV